MGHLIDAQRAGAAATNGWCTPPHLVAALGAFDLDPCAADAQMSGQLPATAARMIARPGDGLSAPWEGRVFLNPPYTDTGRWMARLAAHGHGTALIFARTETGWFGQYVWGRADALLFLAGRVRFIRQNGRQAAAHNAPAPSVLVAYGAADAEALARCGLPGVLVHGWDRPALPGAGTQTLFDLPA